MKFMVIDDNGKHIFNADKKFYWLTDEKGNILIDKQINNMREARKISQKICDENKITVYINSYAKNFKKIEDIVLF